ncbi:pentapeptide repeat-containing protein [Capnocytophaga leadbetteri]|uniref:pentapeptide repeat-containing protein n=1 Tax=Capnocytophaga leadbetteri TaxID=327575 RepID=UPI0028D23D01|nr:pentapeptide repeat-containing protein [Capnocytophaga leadbetteri]
MKEEFKKYIKKEKYNPDIDKTEIWIGNFSNDPTIDPIITISEIISHFKNQDNKIIIDDYLQYNNERIWEIPLEFNDITFNKSVHFKHNSFKDYIYFKNCIFIKEVFFQKCAFNKEVYFINSIFKERTNFRGAFFCSISNFSDTVFEGEQNNFSFIHSFEDFYCENINLKSSIDFSYADFKKTVSFERAVFEGEADFSNVEFGKYIRNDLEYSEYAYAFKKYIEETAIQLKGLLENTSKFIEIKNDENDENSFFSIIFNDAVFNENAIFRESVFENMANFTNTKFEKLVDFHLVEFNKAQQFYSTTFLDRAIFSNTIFHGEAQFLYCLTDSNSYIGFESAIFKKGLDISRSNFNDKVNFWNIELEEKDIFTSSKYQNDFPEEAETESTKNTPTIYKKIRETYRIIKNNFYSQNNKIEGLKFYEKEMSVYLEEKRAEDKNTKQSKEKNKSLTSNSKANIITNSNKINFNNIKKKYLNTYNFLDLLFAIGLSFIIVCFSVIYPLFWFLRKAIHLFAQKVSYKDLKNSMKKIINNKNFYLYIKIFIRICFNRLISLKNNNFFLFIVTFLTIIFILGIMYIVQHKYIWYWFFVFLIILLFYIISYQNRKIIKSNIKSNNYISLVLLSIPSIIILVIFYGINNYKNDWIYRLLNYLSIQFSIIVKDEQIFSFILTIISIITAIVLAIISNKQDKLLLWFNKNSNIFGTDWVVGINFTILVTLVAYIIILYSSPNLLFLPNLEGVGNFLKGLVDILNLTDWNDITILGEKLTTWQYIFLFIGRIFVAYGVYQTVQAFRKFGKS